MVPARSHAHGRRTATRVPNHGGKRRQNGESLPQIVWKKRTRSQTAAAHLQKQWFGKRAFPRLASRGLIEASIRPGSGVSEKRFSRSRKRGPIEAASSVAVRPSQRSHFRASFERGSIEALLSPVECPRRRNYVGHPAFFARISIKCLNKECRSA